MFKFSKITKEERQEEIAKTKRLLEFLEGIGMKVFINYGTLLGTIREGGLILHDNDIDICYISKFQEKKEVFRECQEIKYKLNDLGMLEAFFGDVKFFPDEIEKSCYGQLHTLFENKTFDLFTNWLDSEGNYWMCQWGNLGKIELEPFRTVDCEGIGMKVPKESERILEVLFKDWETPRDEKIGKHRERIWHLKNKNFTHSPTTPLLPKKGVKGQK